MEFSKVFLGIVLVGVVGVAAVTQLLANLKIEYAQMTPKVQGNTIVYQGLEDFY